MSESIFFIGHVSMDYISNINGKRRQPGGSAFYSAVAAKTLLDDVKLVSIIGKDYVFEEDLNVFPKRFIKTYNMPSTRFTIDYNEKWEATYVEVNYGAGSRISVSDIPLKTVGSKNIIHLAPMKPSKIENFVNKIKEFSPDTLISVNTWIDYMKSSSSRKTIKKITPKIDFFVLNDSEAKALTQTKSISSATKLIDSKMLIITLGDLGAIIRNRNGDIQMIPSLNFQTRIIDTTGAGDVWCGSFLAAYKITNDLMKSVSTAAIISSIKCSGWGYSKISNLRFTSLDDTVEYVLGIRDGNLQKSIVDYL